MCTSAVPILYKAYFPVFIITIHFFFQIDQIKNEIDNNTVIVTDYILTSLEIYVNTSTDTLLN